MIAPKIQIFQQKSAIFQGIATQFSIFYNISSTSMKIPENCINIDETRDENRVKMENFATFDAVVVAKSKKRRTFADILRLDGCKRM